MAIMKCRICGKLAKEEVNDPCPSLCAECLDDEVAKLETEFDLAVQSGALKEGDGVDFMLNKMKKIGYTPEAIEDAEIMIFQGMMLQELSNSDVYH